MRVLSVVGNRPQFIKSRPVSAALREAGIEEIGLHTGQHWDPELSDVFYEELGLPVAAARMPEERPPLYGDGHAAERVVASLAAHG